MRITVLENEDFMYNYVTQMGIKAYKRLSNIKTDLILLEEEENQGKLWLSLWVGADVVAEFLNCFLTLSKIIIFKFNTIEQILIEGILIPPKLGNCKEGPHDYKFNKITSLCELQPRELKR